MKSILKIIRRYSLSAALITVVVLICNIVVFGYYTYSSMSETRFQHDIEKEMELIGTQLQAVNGEYQMSPEGEAVLAESWFVWAMALDRGGNVVWSYNLPDEVPLTYAISDVASFSRWYLCDYPVRVWTVGEFLLVFADSPESTVRYDVITTPEAIVSLPLYVQRFLTVNIIVITLFTVLFGYRFYRFLKPVAQGIENLSRKEPVNLPEKGMIEELARKLNRTSAILKEQDQKLEKRDQTRIEWISGVSHDIRTPLALIMGYSDCLAASGGLSQEEHDMAETICRQSLIIKQLIEDLNLTSKLSYDAAPLHLGDCSPGQLLRECVADVYNIGLDSKYEIRIFISESAEQVRITADAELLKRAVRNLLGNSIRHNPSGCQVEARLSIKGECLEYLFMDSGQGIGEEIVNILNGRSDVPKEDKQPHIMGLRLTRQIARAHGGNLEFQKRVTGNYDCGIVLPLRLS